ncbi:MAG: hypothetical protein ACAH83_16470 [Alphaproteobacteria bacterium]|jgi:hypothetical protein
MKKSHLKLSFLLICTSIIVVGCNREDGEAEKVIQLKTELGFATLKIPKNYVEYAGDKDWLVTLKLFYPEMRPAVPRSAAESTMIQIIVDRKDPVESFMSRINGDHYDEHKPAATYRAGNDGRYEVFSSIKPPFSAKSSGTYYVFKGSDGRNVLVDATTALKYSFKRKVNDELMIRYLIPKTQAADFYEADKTISQFVSQHIEK